MNTNSDRVTLTLFYVGSFVVYYLVTMLITLFPNYGVLRNDGLLVPVLCLFEFAVSTRFTASTASAALICRWVNSIRCKPCCLPARCLC